MTDRERISTALLRAAELVLILAFVDPSVLSEPADQRNNGTRYSARCERLSDESGATRRTIVPSGRRQ
jgi:hypothetical protein